jgi:GntR family transcriptional repressor for pyruvate dehydrogenase complex
LAIETRLQTVRKVRVYEEIVSQITSLILNGELKVGDKLPSERELGERFGVGRNSVREATRALESANLVETRQGEGTFIVAGPDSLVPVLSASISGDESGIHLLFEARRVLEPQIAALAAKRATPDELEELGRILGSQRVEVDAGRNGIEEDTLFHLTLANAAKNEFLLKLLRTLLESLRERREQSIREQSDRIRSHETHLTILDAIRAKNEGEATASMLSHLIEIEGGEADGDFPPRKRAPNRF